MVVRASLEKPLRAVAIYLDADLNARLLDNKEAISGDLGGPEWVSAGKKYKVEISRPELTSRPEGEQFAWLLDQMERFTRVFRPWIENLLVVGSDVAAPTAEAADG
jgi:hypothetical protein